MARMIICDSSLCKIIYNSSLPYDPSLIVIFASPAITHPALSLSYLFSFLLLIFPSVSHMILAHGGLCFCPQHHLWPSTGHPWLGCWVDNTALMLRYRKSSHRERAMVMGKALWPRQWINFISHGGEWTGGYNVGVIITTISQRSLLIFLYMLSQMCLHSSQIIFLSTFKHFI